MNKPEGESLQYEQRGTLISSKQYRPLLVLTMVNTILLAVFVVGPTVGPLVEGQWANIQAKISKRNADKQNAANFAQAQAYTQAVDEVVYDERPDEAAKILAADAASGQHRYRSIAPTNSIYLTPHPWQVPIYKPAPQFVSILGNFRTANPLVFSHTLQTRSGKRRLVCVTLYLDQPMTELPPTGDPKRREFEVMNSRLFEVVSRTTDGEPGGSGSVLRFGRESPVDPLRVCSRITWRRGPIGWDDGTVETTARDMLTIYAGQLDLSDSSHFTIDYLLDKQKGTIDGWLREDDRVELVPSAGGVIDRNQDGSALTWDPRLSPTTLPAK